MNGAEAYATSHAQLIATARSLTADQLATPVPALPGWTIKDTLGHLTGVAADIVDGRLDGAGSPEWTARQVAERADLSITEVCDEWVARAPAMVAWMEAAGRDGMRGAYDIWNHQQDIRGALGLDGIRDERLDFLVSEAVGAFDGILRQANAAAVRMHGETVDRVIGGDDAEVELRSGDYDMMRMLFGRRSQVQIDQMYWNGDYATSAAHLHLFPLPEINLID